MQPGKIMMVALLAVGLVACETNNTGQKEMGGAVLGAVVGGLLGSKIEIGRAHV